MAAGFGISVRLAKRSFFDRQEIIRAVEKARRDSLSRAGAFVRTTAQQSMRRVSDPKKVSKPGSPPFAREGSLKRLLFFSYERSTRSVIVGPAGFRGSRAPEVLEFGGRTTREKFRRRQGRTVVVKKPVTVAARPYMAPALEKNLPKIPEAWRGAVRR